jgi:transcriptional regulator GlxA family with amidase domain
MEYSGTLESVEQAARLMRDEHLSLSPGDIARMVGMSERNMQRYFLFYIGVSPKSFMRIARFNTVTKLLEQQNSVKWQDILMVSGYYDSAHFSREFKSITGRTPSEYYRSKAEYERFFYGI